MSASIGRTLGPSFVLKNLQVWNLETGRALNTLFGSFDPVLDVAVSADGRRAVSVSEDKTLTVLDLESGRRLRTLIGHSGPVLDVAVTPDGRRAVSASDDKTLKVWDLETGRALRTLEGHSGPVCGVAVSGDGLRVVSASGDNTLKVWDSETGRALRTLEGHSGWVLGVAVSADGRRVVSASADNTLKVWDLETFPALDTLAGYSTWVYAALMALLLGAIFFVAFFVGPMACREIGAWLTRTRAPALKTLDYSVPYLLVAELGLLATALIAIAFVPLAAGRFGPALWGLAYLPMALLASLIVNRLFLASLAIPVTIAAGGAFHRSRLSESLAQADYYAKTAPWSFLAVFAAGLVFAGWPAAVVLAGAVVLNGPHFLRLLALGMAVPSVLAALANAFLMIKKLPGLRAPRPEDAELPALRTIWKL